MNIFVTSPNPYESAKALDDRRLNKMILESAQILSTVARHFGSTHPLLYKSTHANHPCTVWARSRRGNYMWLVNHFEALCHEYHYRKEKMHKTNRMFNERFRDFAHLVPAGRLSAFKNVTDFKEELVEKAYKMHLSKKWQEDILKAETTGHVNKYLPKWTKRKPPEWSDYHDDYPTTHQAI